MRKFKSRQCGTVDLDSPKTYKYLPKDKDKLDDMMFRDIGRALVYMDYLVSRKGLYNKRKIKVTEGFMKRKRFGTKREADAFLNSGYYQRQRIYKLIKNFADNRSKHFNDVKWLREQVFLFQNETENQC
jgi:hypothetical protein